MLRRLHAVSAVLACALACGPNSKELPQTDATNVSEPTARIRGTVWAPGNAPAQALRGQEIAISGAIISVTAERRPPIPQRTHCEACVPAGQASGTSNHDGTFAIEGLPTGRVWLTIQKGQFRREVQVDLAPGEELELGEEMTTLPSVHDPDNGSWIPRIALALGAFDHIEDVLGKMRLGQVDGTGELVADSINGAFDVYANGGRDYGTLAQGTLTELVGDLDRMLQYHILFIPCSGDSDTFALRFQKHLRNLRAYVEAGGKLYVTDWSGEWHDNVFPQQITLGEDSDATPTDTPADAYSAADNTWHTTRFGDSNGSPGYTSANAEAIDTDLSRWLEGQSGPILENAIPQVYNPSAMEVGINWNTIATVNAVEVGVDDDGTPIIDKPKVLVVGSSDQGASKTPLTVTYEPAGCGRVLYSTYHTADDVHVGLIPQERILLYLIMEIGVCKAGPIP